MILDTQVIKDFEGLQKKINRIINVYGTKKRIIYEHLKISKATLNRKLAKQSFSISEMYKLAELFNSLQRKD